MSSAPAAKKPLPDIDPEAGLMLVAADLLIPLFKTGSIDVPLAREMAICAIKAYYPESSADYVNIARTIAFSMACLALLGNAGSPETPFAEKMRAFGRANTLNRSADQSERTMMQRRRYQRANPPGEPEDCGPPESRTEQVAAAKQEAMQTEIAAAVQEYVEARGHAAEAPVLQPVPATATQPALRAAALQTPPSASPIHRPAATSTTAIHHGTPQTGNGHPGAMSFKASLLQQTSLQSVLKPDAGQLHR